MGVASGGAPRAPSPMNSVGHGGSPTCSAGTRPKRMLPPLEAPSVPAKMFLGEVGGATARGRCGDSNDAPARHGHMTREALSVSWYRFRATFSHRWGGYLSLVLLIG